MSGETPVNKLLLWEAFLTFATTVTASLGLINVVPTTSAALAVLIVQGLNAATIVYKTGQWNPPNPPVTVGTVTLKADVKQDE